MLNGAHILVTRPEHQAENLSRMIETQGGVAVRFPTLQIVGIDNQRAATNSIEKLSNRQWLIFTSANAVNFVLKANGGKIVPFLNTRIAAIGKTTARELQSAGLSVDLIPQNGFDSEALLDMSELQSVIDQSILIIKGHGGREELANVLRSRGAMVDYWDVYQRVIPMIDNAEVLDLLNCNKLNAIVITSFEALQNLLKMIDERYHQRLVRIPLIVISSRISQLAAKIGFMRIAVTESPSDTAILDSTIAVITERSN